MDKLKKLLEDYKMKKMYIKGKEREIEFVEDNISVDGISYDGVYTSPTNKISSIVEDKVLSKTEKVHYLERCILREQLDVDKIDDALEGLEELERTIVVEKYIENKQWWQVAAKVCYSESWCKQLGNKALQRMVGAIWREE